MISLGTLDTLTSLQELKISPSASASYPAGDHQNDNLVTTGQFAKK